MSFDGGPHSREQRGDPFRDQRLRPPYQGTPPPHRQPVAGRPPHARGPIEQVPYQAPQRVRAWSNEDAFNAPGEPHPDRNNAIQRGGEAIPGELSLWPPILVVFVGVALTVITPPALHAVGLIVLKTVLGLTMVIGGVVWTVRRAKRNKRVPAAETGQPRPVGWTDDGRPIFPVVGYTPDGAPITADRAQGYQPHNPRTNSLAIAALVTSFIIPVIAIPLGHSARTQIQRSGEQGDGLAVAALIIGYFSTIAFVVYFLTKGQI